MKDICKITFGAIIAVGMVAPLQANSDLLLNNTSVWVAGTYMKTSDNGLSVGSVITSATDSNTFDIQDDGQRQVFLEPGYEWNYSLGARFHIPHSHANVFFSYDRFRGDEDRSDANLMNIAVPEDYAASPNTSASANVLQKADEFRFGLDGTVLSGRRFCLNLSTFLEADRVVRDVHQANQNLNTTDSKAVTRDTENELRGYGLGVGALGRVHPFAHARNWSGFAGVMSTLLISHEEFSDYWIGVNQGGGTWFMNFEPETSKSLIGKLDINLGIEYACRENNKFLWDVALGMRLINYFNAFKNGNTMWQPAGGTWYAPYYSGAAEDWGRWGPYLQFSVGGPKS